MNGSVRLSNGLKMPLLGLGCWQADDERDVAAAVEAALLAGYRHIDNAYIYENEQEVGKGIKAALNTGKVSRSDVFVVTKLPLIGMQPGKVEKYLRKSLKLLDLDYVDLYLIHHPVGLVERDENENVPMENGKVLLDFATDLIALWKQMERMAKLGLAKTIGVSNFNANQLVKVVAISEIPPTVNQVECHVYFQQQKLREVCKGHDIAITAYGSLGAHGRNIYLERNRGVKAEVHDLLDDPVVRLVAEKHERTAAQVLLRFLVQQDVIVIPGSTNVKRILENGDIFSFQLDDLDMAALRSLDRGEAGRTFKYLDFFPGYDEHPECPFY